MDLRMLASTPVESTQHQLLQHRPLTFALSSSQDQLAAVSDTRLHLAAVQEPAVLLPHLSRFIALLLMLMAEPAPSVSLGALGCLTDLVSRVGFDIKPYLG